MADPLGLISGNGASPLRGVQPVRPGIPGAPVENCGPAFKEILTESLDKVNEAQQEASTAAEDLMTGKRTDIEGVMLATQKADTAFRMLLALKNKVQAAYEEIKQVRV